jgi:hypothetical protein
LGFPTLGAAFYTQTAHQYTKSLLYAMWHAWYEGPQCRPLDSGVPKCWLQLACHGVTGGSSIHRNWKQTAVNKLESFKNFLQICG